MSLKEMETKILVSENLNGNSMFTVWIIGKINLCPSVWKENMRYASTG